MAKTYYIVRSIKRWNNAFDCPQFPGMLSPIITGFGIGFLPVFATEEQALEYLGDPGAKEMVFKMQEVEKCQPV